MSQTQFFVQTEVIAYKDGDEPVHYVLDENNLAHLAMLFNVLQIGKDNEGNEVNESEVIEFLTNFATKAHTPILVI